MKKFLLKFISTLLVAVMLIGATPVFAADGDEHYFYFTSIRSQKETFTVEAAWLRVYAANHGDSRITLYVKRGEKKFGKPLVIEPGDDGLDQYNVGQGDITLYVVNRNGNQLDLDITAVELDEPAQ